MRIVLVSPTSLRLGCGIGDHGYRLAEAMARSAEVWMVASSGGAERAPPEGLAGVLDTRSAFRRFLRQVRPDAVLLQHAPHLGSPRGLNLRGLPFAALSRSAGAAPWIFFHETARPYQARPGAILQGTIQRAVAASLLGLAAGAFVPSRERIAQLAVLDPTRRLRIEFVPVGSGVRLHPVPPDGRESLRRTRSIDPGSVVLTLFGRGHESLLADRALAALEATLAAGVDAHLVAIGSVADRLGPSPAPGRVHRLGFLPEAEVSAWLSATDVFLLPLSDGVSTRRTTLAAALGHGLATVATRGANTDREFFDGGFLELAGCDDGPGFAAAVVRLARDPAAREGLAGAGHRTFLARLAWERLAERTLAALGARSKRRMG